MKKIILILSLVFMYITGYCQFQIPRDLGHANNMMNVPGALKSNFFILPVTDTVHSLATYKGALIYRTIDDQIYVANGNYWELAFVAELVVNFPASTNTSGDTLFFKSTPNRIPFAGVDSHYTDSDFLTYSDLNGLFLRRNATFGVVSTNPLNDKNSYGIIFKGGNDSSLTSAIYMDVLNNTGGLSLNAPDNFSFNSGTNNGSISTNVRTYIMGNNSEASIIYYGTNFPLNITNGVINKTTGEIFQINRKNEYNTNRPQYKIYANGQSVQGDSVVTPDPSALLDLQSVTKGFLTTRMTTSERLAISSPAEGLEVYDLDYHSKMVYDGTRWTGYRYNGTVFQGFNGVTWVDLN